MFLKEIFEKSVDIKNLWVITMKMYSFVPNYRRRGGSGGGVDENEPGGESRFLEMGGVAFRSFSYNNLINLRAFFPKICTPPPPPTALQLHTTEYGISNVNLCNQPVFASCIYLCN